MEFTISQIAKLLNGKVEGDGSQNVYRIDKIQEGKPGGISFLSNLKYEPYLYTTESSAVIVSEGFRPSKPVKSALIRVADAYLGFTLLLESVERMSKPQFGGVEDPSYMHESSVMGKDGYRGAFSYIGKNCHLGERVQIHPHVYIGDDVAIGDDCIIHPGAKIMRKSRLGTNCEIHPGAVIGSDGFGFAPQADGRYKNIPQLGNVQIGDHVSIGANTTIDCATIGSTLIGQGVKIDNLVQIAHNVKIGENTVIASQSGISGSAEIGKNCILAGKSSIVGHIKIADNTTVGGNTAIMKGIETSGSTLLGYIGMDIKDFLKSYAVFKKLPELQNKLKDLEKNQ
ncbi:UDP-3-O-[3-hydroxymyristoyl] glucosamine N-acyltransferase [Lunatimonas lonarensis]|uniref:UDP-3-O-acylglucosamine N-acyltransferase n=1 Tax=Lunatimonas lonarensis TaxID=1232681 RepID=R7ZQ54_9BACT|nr:UDP-3-O-(3-hydroxymyristoyl)glucosamine N-acyltransferase [Lunatimonas lonarensis]EON76245.1 UDP-3-O-[3-hydroxymyristoyl] glucosamine N-acyltransferase [Lunatimonas lonarensis]